MADLLSQEEIEAILDMYDEDPVLDVMSSFSQSNTYNDVHVISDRKVYPQITLYDFKRPNRVSKEQLRAFRGIHDKMARSMSAELSKVIR